MVLTRKTKTIKYDRLVLTYLCSILLTNSYAPEPNPGLLVIQYYQCFHFQNHCLFLILSRYSIIQVWYYWKKLWRSIIESCKPSIIFGTETWLSNDISPYEYIPSSKYNIYTKKQRILITPLVYSNSSSVRLYLRLLLGGFVFCLHYLRCLRIVIGVSNTYCVVFMFVFLRLVYHILPVSLDCPFDPYIEEEQTAMILKMKALIILDYQHTHHHQSR
jgi:hypothetical protein